jgi:trans-aconitate 2-methyltransferase
MARGDWQPGQYERFRAQRSQPFWDLAALLDTSAPIGRAADLGCGSGSLTAELAERLGIDEIVGVDNSPNMLADAESVVSDRVRFEHGDIAEWTAAGEYDLVFSNAALQWVPDHPAVLARWVAALRPGGRIAVQVPANSDHASHRASIHVAHREPFLSALDSDPPPDPVEANVLAPEEYSALLVELGIREPLVRLYVYPHEMPSSASVVEWTKGTSLTRFFKRLPDELHEPFVDAYRDELLARIGDHEPYLFTFKRILMSGRTNG